MPLNLNKAGRSIMRAKYSILFKTFHSLNSAISAIQKAFDSIGYIAVNKVRRNS